MLGIVGIILGAMGRKSALETGLPSGTATAGLVMSIVAVSLGALFFTVCGGMFRRPVHVEIARTLKHDNGR